MTDAEWGRACRPPHNQGTKGTEVSREALTKPQVIQADIVFLLLENRPITYRPRTPAQHTVSCTHTTALRMVHPQFCHHKGLPRCYLPNHRLPQKSRIVARVPNSRSATPTASTSECPNHSSTSDVLRLRTE